MARTDFARMRCPVARAMAVLGERWAMLILREAFYGSTRFDEFERHLGIAPNILSARLRGLVAAGLLKRVAAEGGRHAYRLTEKGRDVLPVYLALKRWGDRWMGDAAGPLIRLEDKVTGAEVSVAAPVRADGTPIRVEDLRVLPGPGAGRTLRQRFGQVKESADV